MPFAPRLERTRGGVVAHRPEGLELAHRHRGGDEERRVGRQRVRERARHVGLAELRRRATASIAPAATSVGRAPASPARTPAPAVAARSAARVGAAARVSTTDAGSCQTPWGSTRICRASEWRASQSRSGLEVGRSPTRMTTSGVPQAKCRRAAAGRSGRSRPRRCVRPIADRRAAGIRRAQPARGSRGASPRSSRPGDDHPAGGLLDQLGERERFLARIAQPPSRAGRPERPAPPRPDGGLGHERLAQRPVEVHRARGGAAGGDGVGAAGERADPGAARGGVVIADLEEPAHGVAVELDLVDRLAGADVAQLGRAVRGQHDQRDARLARLDHGGERGSPPRCPTCR